MIALNNDLNELFDKVMEIKQGHIVKDEEESKYVYHFTQFDTLLSMLPAQPSSGSASNLLRLYNFVYMNDPQEGKRLLDKNNDDTESLREFFNEEDYGNNPLSWEQHESSVYIGSFTLKGDELDMWRTTYGNNGQGYCIVTPLSAFEQGALDEPPHGDEPVKVTEREFGAAGSVLPTLYEVRYDDKHVKTTLSDLKSRLVNINTKWGNMRGSTKALDRTVRLIVSHILYLYKNSDYRTEKEVRMIVDYDISFEGLKLDLTRKPSRIYVESLDFLLKEGSSIVIGPTVSNQTVTAAELDIKYRLKRHGFDKVKISRSKKTDMYR
jgi:hypothetical protein